jgi:hypothetical protein
MRITGWIGAIAVIVVAFEGAVFAVNSAYPSCPYGERIRMPMPFASNGGYAYVAYLPELERLADKAGETGSPLAICENHWVLGPAHASHRDIADRGRGHFSHWGNNLIFSTSDNSDPNTNGRSYLAIRISRR